MKVIHFITDDKFLNAAIKLFEEIHELDNRYINIVFDKDIPFEYISSDKVERINISNIHDIISNPVCDVIVLHNLSSLPCEYIKQINEKIKVVWLSWGFDIYNNKKPQFPLVPLKNQIKPHTISPRYRIRILNEGRRLFFKNLKHYDAKGRQDFIDAVHRVDYYSGVLTVEDIYESIASSYGANQQYEMSIKYELKALDLIEKGKILNSDFDPKSIIEQKYVKNEKNTFVNCTFNICICILRSPRC